VGEDIFLNLAAECSLILDDYIHKSFLWRQQRKFHLKHDWWKSTKFIICNGL